MNSERQLCVACHLERKKERHSIGESGPSLCETDLLLDNFNGMALGGITSGLPGRTSRRNSKDSPSILTFSTAVHGFAWEAGSMAQGH